MKKWRSIVFGVAALLLLPLLAGAQNIPMPGPPQRVPSPFDVNTSTATKKCAEYKTVQVQYQCGTENKCWTEKRWDEKGVYGPMTVCADVPKHCTREVRDCARWE